MPREVVQLWLNVVSQLESKSSRLAKSIKPTHISQTSSSTTVSLPPTIPIASNRYRSVNDPSLSEASKNSITYLLRDTPGHGKLRELQGISQLRAMLHPKKSKSGMRGVIFVVDAAVLSEQSEALRDAASYLHDVLLILQKRTLNSGKPSSKVAEVAVLVAANKQDLFTALPPGSVRDKLESEIDGVRKSRSKGLMDSSINPGGSEEEDILGGDDDHGTFSFKSLAGEVGVQVDVIGGAVKGDNEADVGAGVRRWEEWIGMCL